MKTIISYRVHWKALLVLYATVVLAIIFINGEQPINKNIQYSMNSYHMYIHDEYIAHTRISYTIIYSSDTSYFIIYV